MSDSSLHFECYLCSQRFSRADHRKRHEQTHSNHQPFSCLFCDKRFSRRDAAKRHQKSHAEPPRARRASFTSPLVFNKSCATCSQSRIKCSGNQPCRNCAAKELQCVYLPRKRRRSVYAGHVLDADPPLAGSDTTGLTDSGSTIPEASVSPASHHLVPSDPSGSPAGDPLSYTTAVGNSFLGDNAPRIPDEHAYPAHESFVRPQPVVSPNSNFATTTYAEWASESTSMQTTMLQNIRPINWLPFDQSISEDIEHSGTELPNTTSTTAFPSTVLQSGGHAALHEPGRDFGLAGAIGSPSLHSRMSALVRSMTVGLPGLSNCSSKSALPSDEAASEWQVTFYADGAGARTSQTDRIILKRRETQNLQDDCNFSDAASSWSCTLEAELRQFSQNSIQAKPSIPDEVLEEALSRMSQRLQKDSTMNQFMQHDRLLLKRDTLRFFIHMYFRSFNSLYPFLDQSLLCIPVWGWALCIATAAVGARYLFIPEIGMFSDCLCRHLNELLTQEFNSGHSEDSLPYIQARTLATIGLCHSHDYSMMNRGYNAASLLQNSCLRFRLLDEDDSIGAIQEGQGLEQAWIAWRFRESRRRTGLFIWLLDCILAIATQTPPRLPTKLLNLRLPSADELWEAETCQEWSHMLQVKQPDFFAADPERLAAEDGSRLTIRDAARCLSTSHSMPVAGTSLAISVLIHVLIRRVWDAAWYDNDTIETSLSATNILARSGSKSKSHDATPQYLATVPEYTKWRNSTCDSLDVLHWDALSISARLGGHEDPLFLHLHLARLVILTPARDLFGYTSSFKRLGGSSSDYPLLPSDLFDNPPSRQESSQILSIWANKDRYKARLALIHAGAIFWHVRRFSSDSFVQPLAVYLAAVTLWAFGKFSVRSATSPSQPSRALGSEVAAAGSQNSAQATNLMHLRPVSSLDDVIEGIADTQSNKALSSFVDLAAEQGSIMSSPSSTPAQQSAASPSGSSRSAGTAGKRRSQYSRRMPALIQIDRPVDDELVQHFIRSGERMTLVLEGVSDLCSDSGPESILGEGAAVLGSLEDIWTVAETYKESLEAIIRQEV